MDDNKLEAKLLKIKALAERGEGGEKEAAIKMYHKLLKKYDIDEKALQKDKLSTGLHMRQISRKIFWSRFFTW